MKQVEEVLGRMAAAIVEASHSRIALTLGLSVLLTVASLYLAATILKVDTDSSRPSVSFMLVARDLSPACM